VRRDRQDDIRPLTISHGANATRRDRSRFRLEFDWQGTFDPTAFLSVPAALRFMAARLPGGWPAMLAANTKLARQGRDLLCVALGMAPPAPDEMIAALAAVPLPDGSGEPPATPLSQDPLQAELLSRCSIQVPVVPWPASPHRVLRISAQCYNSLPQYQRLAAALPGLLAAERPAS
jgi:isopenicillin-N epimerase